MTETTDNAKIRAYLNRVGDLPAVPAVAQKVMELVERQEASVEDLRQVIERDPAIASRILKVANSSLYGFSRAIETLAHAISLLGFRTVRSLVLAASMKGTFKHFGLTEKLLWEHAMTSGAVGASLAGYGGIGVARDEGFTVGLLHDLGKIALSNCSRDEYQKVVQRVYNEGVSFVEAERDRFGFDHAEIGACVAAKWKLARGLEAAIRHHHDAEALSVLGVEEGRLTALATVTTACCTRLGIGRRQPVTDLDPAALPAWAHLGLKDADLEPVLERALEQVEGSSALLV